MAIEQESTPDAAELKMLRRSAIENEIPTYRAVSTRAVFAAICGLVSILSFTHPFFYVFAAAAVVLGWWADRADEQDRRDEGVRRGARRGAAPWIAFRWHEDRRGAFAGFRGPGSRGGSRGGRRPRFDPRIGPGRHAP